MIKTLAYFGNWFLTIISNGIYACFVKDQRVKMILEYLDIHQSATVRELAGQLDVSVMTIRRDVDALAKDELVKIVHGAVLSNQRGNNSFASKYFLLDACNHNIDLKSSIAKKAVSLLKPNDVIFISYGSTTEIFAKAIPNDLPLTVITNALNILMEIRKKQKCNIIFPGGFFHEETLMFESPESVEFIKKNRATMFFTSASGVSDRMGVTSMNHYTIEILRATLASSLTNVLLVDSSKFDQVSPAFFANLGDFDITITDENVPPKYVNLVNKLGKKIYLT